MNDKQSGKTPAAGDETFALKIIRNLAGQIQFMALLLYEIKAGTPLGRVLVVFLNLYLHSECAAGNKRGNLKNIPIKVLAEAAGVTPEELWESLDQLEAAFKFESCRARNEVT
ncbi:hypothetical protein J2Z49_002728 [Desulfofundulus luciae]|uniref:Uncharacterized protein n=1 Tax=Desulfofundulus luciae TaxID=74702 RepID=A0ABU0B541_9FIRM|nr:hypothetical protein [Desulfofundulus luciae]MDQ0287598.1 hypothetical protein [Desulfofundulus luciae]